jgi:hypothetical protein
MKLEKQGADSEASPALVLSNYCAAALVCKSAGMAHLHRYHTNEDRQQRDKGNINFSSGPTVAPRSCP